MDKTMENSTTKTSMKAKKTKTKKGKKGDVLAALRTKLGKVV